MMVPVETDFVYGFQVMSVGYFGHILQGFSCISSWIGGRLGGSKATGFHASLCSAGFT